MKQSTFYEDLRKPAWFPVTPEPRAETVDWAGQVALPPSTCLDARQHLKTAMLQDIPAPAMAQASGNVGGARAPSLGFRSRRWGHGPLALGYISEFCGS